VSLILATDVRRDYAMNGRPVHALRGVSLAIEPGEYVAIAGPSGSGKSTLLHLLGGIDAPSSGTIALEGRRLDRLRDRELTRLRLDDLTGKEVGGAGFAQSSRRF